MTNTDNSIKNTRDFIDKVSKINIVLVGIQNNFISCKKP